MQKESLRGGAVCFMVRWPGDATLQGRWHELTPNSGPDRTDFRVVLALLAQKLGAFCDDGAEIRPKSPPERFLAHRDRVTVAPI